MLFTYGTSCCRSMVDQALGLNRLTTFGASLAIRVIQALDTGCNQMELPHPRQHY